MKAQCFGCFGYTCNEQKLAPKFRKRTISGVLSMTLPSETLYVLITIDRI
jgi:hypothetical protein